MKKIITICLIMVVTFAVNAQQKPTKEQTVKFINRTLQTMVEDGNEPCQIVNFTENELHTVCTSKLENGATFIHTRTWTNFLWESLQSVEIINMYSNSGIVTLDLEFSKYPNVYRIMDEDGVKRIQNKQVTIFQITITDFQKGESLKKAFERLSEIYKEENIDPFKN